MRILHINHSDIGGGAARAVLRLHNSSKDHNIDSKLIVSNLNLNDQKIEGPNSKMEKYLNYIKPKISNLIVKTLITKNPVLHSPSIFPSKWIKKINFSDFDIVHLHWIQHETLSIRDINKINKPIVWTLHDMWAFSGAEHLCWDDRWREGYLKTNRPLHEKGFDLNRWTWERKKKYWKKPIQIVTPSNWLGNCVTKSSLMKNWPVSVIHNPIDINFWKPQDRTISRKELGLPKDIPLLLFGAIYGEKEFHKGFDLLINSLKKLERNKYFEKLGLVFFGSYDQKKLPKLNFPTHYMNYINDDSKLCMLYSACDALVIPSRQDNLPNNGIEAHSCGTPVVAFNIGGLSDIVDHKQTGYLANPFDVDDLANGIEWVIRNGYLNKLRSKVRERAIEKFSNSVVINQYNKLYKKVLNNEKK